MLELHGTMQSLRDHWRKCSSSPKKEVQVIIHLEVLLHGRTVKRKDFSRRSHSELLFFCFFHRQGVVFRSLSNPYPQLFRKWLSKLLWSVWYVPGNVLNRNLILIQPLWSSWWWTIRGGGWRPGELAAMGNRQVPWVPFSRKSRGAS